ncbi:hypothetical protein NP493_140g00010 [Ridgeia piscesae]|uniref:Methyltransferase FkbM domain-containing protein n=1 Tax=Ridgeia piscesae TaxID=27915 RepID=A0AAD9UG41_RIDPI|nr:hypothetical protein NP493_140g00008 [Ridgeia piscesae]KAK2188194.1 hypothetical protein NP493_140g00010 [Ridgeia piscesae]
MKLWPHRFESPHFLRKCFTSALYRCRTYGRYFLLSIIVVCVVHTLISTRRAHPYDRNGAVSDFRLGGELVTSRRREFRPVKHCNIVNLTAPVDEEFNCVRTSTKPPTTVCLYDVFRDVYISHDLQETGVWEPLVTRDFLDVLARDPSAGVIDVGANIGFYSMLAASGGRDVVAVEPYRNSAVTLEDVTARVVIVENAVSDVRTAATVRRAGDNQGDTRIRHGAEPCMGSCSPVVRTVLLDDLLEACRFDRAIMKVDIQGYEHRAFAHAGALFDDIRMTYVFMEWVLMGRHYVAANHTSVDKTLVENMLKFLFERNYRPYTLSSEGERPLDPDVWGAWPDDIVWHLMPNTVEYSKLIRTHFLNWP